MGASKQKNERALAPLLERDDYGCKSLYDGTDIYRFGVDLLDLRVESVVFCPHLLT